MPHQWRPLPVGVGECAWRLHVVGSSQEVVNIMGFDFDTEPVTATANALKAAYATKLMPQLSSKLSLDSVHILYQSDGTHQIVADSNTAAVLGSKTAGATTTMPPQVSLLVRKKTSFAGRSERGRMYLPGVLESYADENGVIPQSDFDLIAAAVSGFFTDIATYHPVLIHSVECTAGDSGHTGPHTGTPPAASALTTLELDDRVATQRRRLSR